MADKGKGKFSIYVRNGELRRKITAIAQFKRVSITQLITGILEDYAEHHAKEIAVIFKHDAEIDALTQQANAPHQQQQTSNTGKPEPEAPDATDTADATSEPETPQPAEPADAPDNSRAAHFGLIGNPNLQ